MSETIVNTANTIELDMNFNFKLKGGNIYKIDY